MLRERKDGRVYDDFILDNLHANARALMRNNSMPISVTGRVGRGIPHVTVIDEYINNEAKNDFSPELIESFLGSALYQKISLFDEYEVCKFNKELTLTHPRLVIGAALSALPLSITVNTAMETHSCPLHNPRARKNPPKYQTFQRFTIRWFSESEVSGYEMTLGEITGRYSAYAFEIDANYTVEEYVNVTTVIPSREIRGYGDPSISYWANKGAAQKNLDSIRALVPQGDALVWHYLIGYGGVKSADISSHLEPLGYLAERFDAAEVYDLIEAGVFKNIKEMYRFVKSGITVEQARILGTQNGVRSIKRMLANDVDPHLAAAVLEV